MEEVEEVVEEKDKNKNKKQKKKKKKRRRSCSDGSERRLRAGGTREGVVVSDTQWMKKKKWKNKVNK